VSGQRLLVSCSCRVEEIGQRKTLLLVLVLLALRPNDRHGSNSPSYRNVQSRGKVWEGVEVGVRHCNLGNPMNGLEVQGFGMEGNDGDMSEENKGNPKWSQGGNKLGCCNVLAPGR
jgi:hypothetical protein